MKQLLIFLLIPLFSFTQEQISEEKLLEQITEEKVIDNIKGFFSALNVKNYDKIICEVGLSWVTTRCDIRIISFELDLRSGSASI